MNDDQEIRDWRSAIGRELAERLTVEREVPPRLIELLRELRRSEEATRSAPHVGR